MDEGWDDILDEESENRQDRALKAMNEFIDAYLEERGGNAKLYEFGMFLFALLFRMRQTLTFEQLANYTVGVLNVSQASVMKAKEEHGADMILAEDWQGVEGGQEMIQSLHEYTNRTQDLLVPEDWTLEEE